MVLLNYADFMRYVFNMCVFFLVFKCFIGTKGCLMMVEGKAVSRNIVVPTGFWVDPIIGNVFLCYEICFNLSEHFSLCLSFHL